MGRKDKKEKCKDEPESNGQPRCGDMSPATARWSAKQEKAGLKSPLPGHQRNNPREDWTPRERNPKSHWVRKGGGGKNGPSRGGDRAVAKAAAEATYQADGMKDALREQFEETRVAQDASMHLRRDLTNVTNDLKCAEEKLGLHRNRIDQMHDEKRKNFHCAWLDETERSLITFVLFVMVVPAIFISLVIYLDFIHQFGLFQFMCCWQAVVASMIYQLIAVFADRYICAKRGYRAIFCKRITHSFDAVTQEDWDLLDRRADVMSMRKLLHDNARYSVVAYRKSLNGVLLNTDKFGERTGVPSFSIISHELLAQLTVPTVMYADDAQVVKDRLAISAKTTHTVNVDAYLYQEGEDVARGTAKVALGLWYQSSQRNFAECF